MQTFENLSKFLEECNSLPSNCLFQMSEELNSQDFDCTNFVKISSLLRVFQKAAEKDMFSNGHNVVEDIKNGIQWMVRYYKVVIERTPLYHQPIKIFTWVSKMNKLDAVRNFLITQNDIVICKATSSWFVVDRKAGRPKELPESYRRNIWEMELLNFKLEKSSISEENTLCWEGRVNFYMIDNNQHMNNTYYGLLATEAVSNEFRKDYTPYDFEIYFKSGAKFEDNLVILTDVKNDSTFHSLRNKDTEKELSQVRIKWQKN